MTHIYKIANGSLSTAIGDTRLFYTGNYSVRASAINGIFLDNPPVLSPNYATLIWRYYNDTDRYMLIHVQGSQVVDASQGRNYPYRAAFEVTRDDLNALAVQAQTTNPVSGSTSAASSTTIATLPNWGGAGGEASLPISSLFANMPRIQQYTSTERVTEQHEVARQLTTPTVEATNLAYRIIAAFNNAQPLYIAINTDGNKMHGNGVFSAPQLQTLLTAIEQLPLSLARYATFAFCADQHAAGVMDNILINIIPEGAKIQLPEGCQLISWAEATSQPFSIAPTTLDTIFTVASALPGSTSPLTPVTEASIKFHNDVIRFNIITAKKPTDVAIDEWDTWFITHNISEIQLHSWDEFITMSKHMPQQYLTKLAAIYHTNALQWSDDERMYDHADIFEFSNTELTAKLNIEQLIKLNRKVINNEGRQIEQENILELYTPQIIADAIATYKNLAQGPLDATEKILTQCISIKKYRDRNQYAFEVLYCGVVNYLCDKYSNITNIDSWVDITKQFWKLKMQEDGNKKKALIYPLTFKTLNIVFQSRINAMADQQLTKFTTEVVNQYSKTKDKGILSLVHLLHSSLK